MALGLGNTFDISVKFLADLESYIQGVEKGSKKIEQFGKRVQKVGTSLTKNLTLPIIALGAATVNASLKMNKAMSNVATLIPDATERVEELKKEVQDLAIETGKATSEMTAGLYEVISAFGDTEETMARVEANARLAVAGFSSVAEAINFTSAATKGYGDISAEAIQKASDLGLLTVRLGKTTFPALAGSIGRLTGNAKALGITLEELMAVYATLTGVTGDTTRVTTQIDAAMRAFMKPIPGMTEAIKELGFAGSEALIGEKGLVGALRAVLETTDGSVEAVGKLVESTEAFPAIFALAGAQADVFDDKLNQMNDSLGTTDEAFKEATAGINKAGFIWDRFKVKLQVMAERLGDELLPAFSKLLEEHIIPLIEKIAEWVVAFANADEATKAVILGIVAFATVIGPALIGIGKLIIGIKTIVTLFSGKAGLIARISLGTTALLALVAVVVSATIKKAAWRKEMAKTNDEIDRSIMRTDAFKNKADDLNDTIQDQIDLNEEDAEKFEDVRDEVVKLMQEYPGFQTELGITADESGVLYDANGDLVDSFSELQTLLNSFSTSAIRDEYEAAFLSAVESFKGQLDAYRSFEFVFPGFHTKLSDIEEAYSRLESTSRRYVNALREIEELTRPGGTLFVEPGTETKDKDKDKDREPSGTPEEPVSVIIQNAPGGVGPGRADIKYPSALDLFTAMGVPKGGTFSPKSAGEAGFEEDRRILNIAQEIVSELGFPWIQALYYASQGYTVEDLKELGMVFPGDPGFGISGPGAVVKPKGEKTANIIKDMFMSISDTILDSARLLGKSIVSGDIASALTNIFSMIGNAISEKVSAMITTSIGGGGLFSSIVGAFGGGLIGAGISLIGGLFAGDKDRGADPSKPIFVDAFISNWENFFQFGTTLPTSFVSSGRSDAYNVDPHGRTLLGWSTGQHYDA